ncbi:MAG: hypothetical protein KC417_07500, partial [Myxococcales bacterium]|nr:hypothetical protein [Myxococcales bacterium]
DGDGISGRPNYDRGFVGRFGRKAQTVSIEGFIRGPLFNHIGITSNPLSNARKAELPVPSAAAGASGSVQAGLRDDGISVVTAGQAAAPDMPNMDDDDAPDPELSEDDLFDVVSFTMLLAVPRPDEPTAESEAGSELFSELGCDGCHVRALKGPRGLIPAYSDLLLHDMGDDLADDIVMGVAKGNEFRTQPLWGVVAVGPYLHDGRADTLDDAIRFHGGEAKAARDAYVALDGRERRQVLAFLASLGGGDQRSDGLLPPDAAVEAVGEFGGPMTMLTETESALYAAGRAVFDRDTHLGSGLGPEFNGDSCRACHFDPVLGGAGPADVDVTRQGIRSGDQVAEPAGGTMARHFDVSPMRPPIDAASNIFERRQTPALFGLGLID